MVQIRIKEGRRVGKIDCYAGLNIALQYQHGTAVLDMAWPNHTNRRGKSYENY